MFITAHMHSRATTSVATFVADEAGTITVDWAVLTAAAAAMAIAATTLLATATSAFTRSQEAELHLQNQGGRALSVEVGMYTPEDEATFESFAEGLADLSVTDLDALGIFANHLHIRGLHGAGHSNEDATEEARVQVANFDADGQPGEGNGNTFHGGAGNNGFANGGTIVHGDPEVRDFLAAVDHEYTSRGITRPVHTMVNAGDVNAALSNMGLGQSSRDRLWAGQE